MATALRATAPRPGAQLEDLQAGKKAAKDAVGARAPAAAAEGDEYRGYVQEALNQCVGYAPAGQTTPAMQKAYVKICSHVNIPESFDRDMGHGPRGGLTHMERVYSAYRGGSLDKFLKDPNVKPDICSNCGNYGHCTRHCESSD